jgi:hypothetical protein
LYVADVPVEATQHGSALMFRALEAYPPDRLRIVETGLPSATARRLPGVSYSWQPIGRQAWLNTRVHGVYSAWLTQRAAGRAARIVRSMSGFDVEAVATVGHGFGWLAAAAIATRLNVPLHLIVHDDWPRVSAITGGLRQWLDRRFGAVYRAATTRLCVSPFMAEAYERRYGIAGSVMYPSRSEACPVFEAKIAEPMFGETPLTIGYGGNSGPEMMTCLEALAATLSGAHARLAVFGPFDAALQQRLLALSPSISFEGFVPYREMITGLRATADVLFVPMTFAADARDNQIVSFPSKLADYTATGLPLLMWAPPYSSAIRWARAQGDVAEVVDQSSAALIGAAITRLRQDAHRRTQLAAGAIAAGQRCFDSARARASLSTALLGAQR